MQNDVPSSWPSLPCIDGGTLMQRKVSMTKTPVLDV